ncbi:hypothetical protein Vafri_12791 [Volvox africanus]|uniref:Uncharacterized protein n=1 Tax=Volvox africanus TaxID=51714 RepID=A0A8J4BA71_9CHLO|nr:hypothetical protein Vafri_12791 [Volvox africanus]
MANRMLASDSCSTASSLLNRLHSCTNTVFMLSSYLTGQRRWIASTSYWGGSRARHSATTTATRSSAEPLPPPPLPPAVPVMASRDANIAAVSFWSLAMSAFSWRPKASGSGMMGRVSMYARYEARSPSGGA